MSLSIRACRPHELAEVVSSLNQEFVSKKQRLLSLSERFPNVFSENSKNIQIATVDGHIQGAFAVRPFGWVAEARSWRGAMVGMVWVDEDGRGKGIGAAMMASAVRLLKMDKIDFGILWTGQPAFYERAGWFVSDHGLFAQVHQTPGSAVSSLIVRQPVNSVDARWLESLRSRLVPKRVMRSAVDYRTIPIPALEVHCYRAGGEARNEGFALVGRAQGVGYFYEMVAPDDLWDPIWNNVLHDFDYVWVNGQTGEPFSDWLAAEGYVTWQPQNKAMWLAVSDDATAVSLEWHIPYFDWI